ncbi:MAG: hypothetical protein LBG80_13095 [Bacteroidales bacterium]|jgi:DNA-binding response OmpR family regulator|nr:hypothetical protein [Bacteroidales bacterium]
MLLNDSGNTQTYLEIRQEIDYLIQRLLLLQVKVDELRQSELNNKKQEEILLSFDDTSQMIFWDSGSIHLPPKQYLLVKTIWNADNRAATLDVIEENIWDVKGDDDDENVMFIHRNTICELVHRTRNSMNRAKFPYEIKSILAKQTGGQNGKHRSYNELQGYKLIIRKYEK